MKKILIYEKLSNIRIDNFLKREVFLNMDVTRGEIIRNIKAGQVLINGKKIKPSYILKTGDKIEMNIKKKKAGIMPNKNVKFGIIYQDKNIIVINKPAGLQVHPGTKYEADTLVSGLLYQFPEIKNIGDDPENRPGIVHRLDKDTSGIMVIARNQKTFSELKDQFKNRKIKKTYWAAVCGRPKDKAGIIDEPIARSANYKKQVIAGRKTRTIVRSAVTEYKIIQGRGDFSLLEVIPKTGRLHQIRVHLKSIGHPAVGDKMYKLKNYPEDKNIKRQLLHAKSIGFNLYGKKYFFQAELPSDFQNFLDEKEIKY